MYIFLDLEMNTWKSISGELSSEIIEIGAVLMDNDLRIIDTFNQLVRPTHRKKLSPYCLRLTGIDRNKLFVSITLQQALDDLCDWADDYKDVKVIYSWNESDYRQIVQECELKSINNKVVGVLHECYIDYQKVFSKEFDWPTCGLADALKLFGIRQSGRAHRALNDAMDLARLYKKANRVKKDQRRYETIKEKAQLQKIERLNPVVRKIRKLEQSTASDAVIEKQIKEMIFNGFYSDLLRLYKKYNVREVVRSLPELKDWLLVVEGMLLELEDDQTTKETAASSLQKIASGK